MVIQTLRTISGQRRAFLGSWRLLKTAPIAAVKGGFKEELCLEQQKGPKVRLPRWPLSHIIVISLCYKSSLIWTVVCSLTHYLLLKHSKHVESPIRLAQGSSDDTQESADREKVSLDTKNII